MIYDRPLLKAGARAYLLKSLLRKDLLETAVLRETNGVIGGPQGAAAQLGLPRTTLIARMQRLGVSSGTSRSQAGQPAGRFVQLMGRRSSHLSDDAAADSRVLELIAS